MLLLPFSSLLLFIALFSLPSATADKIDLQIPNYHNGLNLAAPTLTITAALGPNGLATLLESAPKASKTPKSGFIGKLKEESNPKNDKSSTSGSASESFLNDTTFQQSCLNSTNTLRALHNATALSWNSTLASYAQNWSSRCQKRHSAGPFGENLAVNSPDVVSAIQSWEVEAQDFNLTLPSGRSNITASELEHAGEKLQKLKHITRFTQLVWKTSTMLGCGRTNCAGQNGIAGWLVVCEFDPKGNVPGQFAENVQGLVNAGGAGGKGGVIGEGKGGGNRDGVNGAGAIGKAKSAATGQRVHRVQVWGVAVVVWVVIAAVLL